MDKKEELPLEYRIDREEKKVIVFPKSYPLGLTFDQFYAWSNEVIKKIIKSHRG